MLKRLVALVFVAPLMIALTTGTALGGGRQLTATLTGAAEVPGPGDPNGSGTATLTLNSGQEQICFTITVEGITLPAIGAHIHEAPLGEPGDIVVPLTPPDQDGVASACVGASRDLIKDIRKHPSAYYVNVHTIDFPGGAIRGQLSK